MPTYTLRINGRPHRIDAEPAGTLLPVLRQELALTGSKYSCGEGRCGACTVLLGGEAARSCAAPERDRRAARHHHRSRGCCCTPGMVMATIGLLRDNPDPSSADIARRWIAASAAAACIRGSSAPCGARRSGWGRPRARPLGIEESRNGSGAVQS